MEPFSVAAFHIFNSSTFLSFAQVCPNTTPKLLNPPTPLLVGVSEIRPLLLLLQMPNCYCFRCSVVSIASLPFPLLPCFHTSWLPWILWIPGSYILSIGEPARPPDSAKAAFSALMHTYHTYHTLPYLLTYLPYLLTYLPYHMDGILINLRLIAGDGVRSSLGLRHCFMRLRFLIPLFSHNSTRKASLRALPSLQLCRILRRFLIRCQKQSGSRKTFVQP